MNIKNILIIFIIFIVSFSSLEAKSGSIRFLVDLGNKDNLYVCPDNDELSSGKCSNKCIPISENVIGKSEKERSLSFLSYIEKGDNENIGDIYKGYHGISISSILKDKVGFKKFKYRTCYNANPDKDLINIKKYTSTVIAVSNTYTANASSMLSSAFSNLIDIGGFTDKNIIESALNNNDDNHKYNIDYLFNSISRFSTHNFIYMMSVEQKYIWDTKQNDIDKMVIEKINKDFPEQTTKDMYKNKWKRIKAIIESSKNIYLQTLVLNKNFERYGKEDWDKGIPTSYNPVWEDISPSMRYGMDGATGFDGLLHCGKEPSEVSSSFEGYKRITDCFTDLTCLDRSKIDSWTLAQNIANFAEDGQLIVDSLKNVKGICYNPEKCTLKQTGSTSLQLSDLIDEDSIANSSKYGISCYSASQLQITNNMRGLKSWRSSPARFSSIDNALANVLKNGTPKSEEDYNSLLVNKNNIINKSGINSLKDAIDVEELFNTIVNHKVSNIKNGLYIDINNPGTTQNLQSCKIGLSETSLLQSVYDYRNRKNPWVHGEYDQEGVSYSCEKKFEQMNIFEDNKITDTDKEAYIMACIFKNCYQTWVADETLGKIRKQIGYNGIPENLDELKSEPIYDITNVNNYSESVNSLFQKSALLMQAMPSFDIMATSNQFMVKDLNLSDRKDYTAKQLEDIMKDKCYLSASTSISETLNSQSEAFSKEIKEFFDDSIELPVLNIFDNASVELYKDFLTDDIYGVLEEDDIRKNKDMLDTTKPEDEKYSYSCFSNPNFKSILKYYNSINLKLKENKFEMIPVNSQFFTYGIRGRNVNDTTLEEIRTDDEDSTGTMVSMGIMDTPLNDDQFAEDENLRCENNETYMLYTFIDLEMPGLKDANETISLEYISPETENVVNKLITGGNTSGYVNLGIEKPKTVFLACGRVSTDSKNVKRIMPTRFINKFHVPFDKDTYDSYRTNLTNCYRDYINEAPYEGSCSPLFRMLVESPIGVSIKDIVGDNKIQLGVIARTYASEEGAEQYAKYMQGLVENEPKLKLFEKSGSDDMLLPHLSLNNSSLNEYGEISYTYDRNDFCDLGDANVSGDEVEKINYNGYLQKLSFDFNAQDVILAMVMNASDFEQITNESTGGLTILTAYGEKGGNSIENSSFNTTEKSIFKETKSPWNYSGTISSPLTYTELLEDYNSEINYNSGNSVLSFIDVNDLNDYSGYNNLIAMVKSYGGNVNSDLGVSTLFADSSLMGLKENRFIFNANFLIGSVETANINGVAKSGSEDYKLINYKEPEFNPCEQ